MSTAHRRIKPRGNTPPANPVQRWIEMFLDYCRSECHLSANTVAAYRRDMAKFAVWLGQRRFQDLTIRELADYPAFLNQRKLAPASIARHIVALKVFFRYLQLEGVLRDNLAELLGSQKLWQRVPQVLSPEMIDQLLAVPRGTRSALASRSGFAGITVCDRLPCLRGFEPPPGRCSPLARLLFGARQGG